MKRAWDKKQLIDIAEEYGGGSSGGATKEYVDKKVTEEATSRKSADDTLRGSISQVSNNLNSESQARAQGDSALASDIENERNARVSAVSQEEKSRINEDEHLQNALNNEISARENTDSRVDDLDINKQEKLVNQTNIKSINGISILGSGNIEIGSGSTSNKRYIFKGESLEYKTIELGDHKKVLFKIYAQGWMKYANAPYWFIIDFNKITSFNEFFLLASKTADDTNELNYNIGENETFWLGTKTSSTSRQIHFSYHPSDKAVDYIPSHNDITWIFEYEFLD